MIALVWLLSVTACNRQKSHTAPAVNERDSTSMMVSYGINTLISDSGVIKYRIVSERWEVNTVRQPSRWIFEKGIFLEQFDEHFHINSYIQADTAYYYDEKHLWELRSRVKVLTKDGLRFSSQQLFWDESEHELYSNVYSHLITPERELEGSYFRSDERMTKYYVSNSKGNFEKADLTGENDTTHTSADTTHVPIRSAAVPRKASPRPH